MSEATARPDVADRARSFVLQVTLLFAAVLTPYFILEGILAPLAAAGVLAAYAVVALVLGFRAGPQGPSESVGNKVVLSLMLYGAGGYMAVTGIATLVVFGWFGLAYRPIDFGNLPVDFGVDVLGRALSSALSMLAVGFALLALAIVLLHWGHGGPAALAARLRRLGPGRPLAPWLSECAIILLLLGGSVFLMISVSLEILADMMARGREISFVDVATAFPFLPAGLFAMTILTVCLVDIIAGHEPYGVVIRALRDDAAPAEPRDAWWPVLATITVSAASGIVGAIIWAGHFAIVGATAAVPATIAGRSAALALDSWAYEEELAGRTSADIAAMVNEMGFWTAAQAERGLADLLPDFLPALEEDFFRFGPEQACRVDVTAAPAAATDDIAMTSLRYCVRAACSTPVVWDAAPATSLVSSHPSENDGWIATVYVDLAAAGKASEPGGFCTADGSLAESFQG